MTENTCHGNIAIAPCWEVVGELIILHVGVTPNAMLTLISRVPRLTNADDLLSVVNLQQDAVQQPWQ